MHRILGGTVALALVMAMAVSAATSASKKKKSHTPPMSQVAQTSQAARMKAPVVSQKSSTKSRTVTSASHRKTPARSKVTWRTRQMQPTQDRYKEIQNALVTKGYLQPEQATGSWDQSSSAALKQFQTQQNLDASGKIDSLSLIALGLGPKHDAAPAQISQPADQSR